MTTCDCQNVAEVETRHLSRTSTLSGVVAAAGLMLMPKCPACVMAWVAMLTGVSISFASAAVLRWTALAVLTAMLLAMAVNRGIRQCGRGWSPFRRNPGCVPARVNKEDRLTGASAINACG